MCGIWFSSGYQPSNKVLDVINHRGPDSKNLQFFNAGNRITSIGHVRLSIIDLSDSAKQPFLSACKRYLLTFNGEIYNYLELRSELEGLGVRFSTNSDTEVLLSAYLKWGKACLSRLNGMFAFVIYNITDSSFFAARDRFGVKPLYYYRDASIFAIASEIKQFTQLPSFKACLNRDIAFDFLASGLVSHTSNSIFKDVISLKPGQLVVGSTLSNKITVDTWYELPKANSLDISFADAKDEFQRLFYDSIKLRLRSDVPIGSCLSGGLDSSSIVGIASAQIPPESKFQTFTSCFHEKYVDERDFVEDVVQLNNLLPSYVYPSASGLVDELDNLTWIAEVPFGSTSVYSQWSVFKSAKDKGIKVLLDGQGADEQLAGYHGAYATYASELLNDSRYIDLLKLVLDRKSIQGVSLRSQLASLQPVQNSRLLSLLSGKSKLSYDILSILDENYWHAQLGSRSPLAEALQENSIASLSTIGDLCHAMVSTSSLNALLHFEDRNSMAHSIESRVPFMDYRLVELNIALGSRFKFNGHTTKYLLREAMKDVLPLSVYERSDKLGFPTPEEVWFKTVLKDTFMNIWLPDTLDTVGHLFNPDKLFQYANDMLNDKLPYSTCLWRFVHFGVWARVFSVSF